MANLKPYEVHYNLNAYKPMVVIYAPSEEEANEEFERIISYEDPIYAKNTWIDSEVIHDCEWDIDVEKTVEQEAKEEEEEEE